MMKNKFSAIIAIILCLILSLSVFTACSVKKEGDDDDTTPATLAADESWASGSEESYQPIEVTGVELVEIVSKALGSEADGFNGDLKSLSDEQVEKVKKTAKENGYVVDTDENGDTVIKKDTAPTTQISSEEAGKILSEADIQNSTKLTDEEYSKVSKIAEENSATALTNENGDLEIIRTTIPETTVPSTKKGDTTGRTAATTRTSGGSGSYTTNKYLVSTSEYSNTYISVPDIKNIDYASNVTFGGKSYVLYNSCDKTTDGIICSGNTYIDKKGNALSDVGGIIAKYSTDNKLQWMDVVTANDAVMFEDVAVLTDGSIVAVGQTMATNIVSASEYKASGTYEVIMIKYDSTGKKLWTRVFGGSGTDSVTSIAATPDNGYIIAGKTYSNDKDLSSLSSSNEQNAYIAKCDSAGNVLWVNGFGGSRSSEFNDVAVSSAGYIYAVLETVNTDGDFSDSKAPSGKRHSYVMRFDTNGTLLWKKDYYESGSVRFEAITSATNSGCIVAGDYSCSSEGNAYSFKSLYNGGTSGSTDVIVMKFDATGGCQWATPLVGYENDHVTGITKVTGGYAVTGYTTSTNRDYSITNKGDYDSFIYTIGEYGDLGKITSFGGSESDRAMGICSIGSTLYSVGCSASSDGSFASTTYKGDGDKTIAFIFKYNTSNE